MKVAFIIGIIHTLYLLPLSVFDNIKEREEKCKFHLAAIAGSTSMRRYWLWIPSNWLLCSLTCTHTFASLASIVWKNYIGPAMLKFRIVLEYSKQKAAERCVHEKSLLNKISGLEQNLFLIDSAHTRSQLVAVQNELRCVIMIINFNDFKITWKVGGGLKYFLNLE